MLPGTTVIAYLLQSIYICLLCSSKFERNRSTLLHVKNKDKQRTPFYFKEHVSISHDISTNFNSLIYFVNFKFNVIFNGTVVIRQNTAYSASIILFQSSRVFFCNVIEILLNNCSVIVSFEIQSTYIFVAEYANITFAYNSIQQLFSMLTDKAINKIYLLCLFQYVSAKNTINISTSHFSINFISNSIVSDLQSSKTIFNYCTSHCRWLPSTVFQLYHPKTINQQIIKIYEEKQNYTLNSSNNMLLLSILCTRLYTRDTLGPIHPGQRLQVGLSVPYNNETSMIYAETYAASLSSSSCKIAHESELVNILTKQCKVVNFTITSNIDQECELFLTAQSNMYECYDVFYIRLLPCPVGFNLINGICNCDPILNANHFSRHVQY